MWAVVLAALAGICLLVALLYAAVALFTFQPANYPQTPPYDAMAAELVDYLSERQPVLSDSLFTERERLHMEDVLALFRGGRRLAVACLCGGLVLSGAAYVLGGRKRLGKGLMMGIGLFFAVALALGIWAAVDFDGWFRAMHEVVFTNDLWLLDPAESMLIRMLPLDFFIRAVRGIVLAFGGGAGLLLTAAMVCRFAGRKEERK